VLYDLDPKKGRRDVGRPEEVLGGHIIGRSWHRDAGRAAV
jgi:hypothetical protein